MLKSLVATFQTVVMGSSLSQQSAVDIITDWRSKPATQLVFESSRPEAYLQAVEKLQQLPDTKAHSQLISVAMDRLKREFSAVLSREADYQAAAGPNSTIDFSTVVTDSTASTLRYEDYAVYEPPSEKVIDYLRGIAERLDFNGDLGECIKLYKSARKNFLISHLKRLDFDDLRIGDNYTKKYICDKLKLKIESWIQVSKICVKILFEREKKFCAQIFGNSVKDECFVGTVDEFAVSLFAFAENISTRKFPYDTMGTVFGLYDAFLSVLPDVDALFVSEAGGVIRTKCRDTLLKIEKDIERMVNDFETTLLNAPSDRTECEKGEISRTTIFVIGQIEVIVKYKTLLTNLIKSDPSRNFKGLGIFQEDIGDLSKLTFLEVHVLLIIQLWVQKLSSNSKKYGDLALENLFIMNNVHYIVQKVEGCEKLKQVIGDSYVRKLHEKVSSAMTSYQSSTCKKFLNCFRDGDAYCFRFCILKSALRRKLKSFNAVFEEIQSRHCSWMVSDSQLAEQIRTAMLKDLVPAYRNFLGKFKNSNEIDAPEKKVVKYSAEDLEDLVLNKLLSGY